MGWVGLGRMRVYLWWSYCGLLRAARYIPHNIDTISPGLAAHKARAGSLVLFFSGERMDYLNRLMGRKRASGEENLIVAENQRSHEIFKNRVLVTSIVNLLVFMVFVFSMAYYKWAIIQIPLFLLNDAESSLVVKGQLSIYVNMLYGKQQNLHYYQSYFQLVDELCLPADIYCQSIFQELLVIGALTFTLLFLGSIVQAYDIYRMVRYFVWGAREGEGEKDNLRHIVTIGFYLVGITLNIFGLAVMEVQVNLGTSFWVFIGGLALFVIVVIAEQIALNNLHRQDRIMSILQSQKKFSNAFNPATIELSSESDVYI